MNWINGQLIFKSRLCPRQWSIYKKKPFSALVRVTPLGRPDLIHSLSGRLDPGSVYFFQTCEARVLVIMHNRS